MRLTRGSRRPSWWWLGSGLVLAGGCSLLTTDVVSCNANTECRSQFGLGWVCGEDGFCRHIGLSSMKRCAQTFPADLRTYLEEYPDTVLVGTIFGAQEPGDPGEVGRSQAARLPFIQIGKEVAAGSSVPLELTFAVIACDCAEDPENDTLSMEEAAMDSADYLVDVLGVPAIIGHSFSSVTATVFSHLMERPDIDSRPLVISPSATSEALTALDAEQVSDRAPGWLWRTAPPDQLQSLAIAHDMLRYRAQPPPGVILPPRPTKLGILYRDDSYGRGLANGTYSAFVSLADRLGLAVDEPQLLDFDGDNARQEAILNAGAAGFDEVLFISPHASDGAKLLDSAATIVNYEHTRIFLTDGGANQAILAEVVHKEKFPDVRGAQPAAVDPNTLLSQLFALAYRETFQSDHGGNYAEHAYDAGWLVAYGVAWALYNEEGPITGRSIAKGLRHLSHPEGRLVETKASSWRKALQYLGEGQTINVTGVSGELDYDPETEETQSPIQIWTLDDPANWQNEGSHVLEDHVWDPITDMW